MDEISQAQKNFVDYFIETGNQTEAYKKAYPTCKTDNSAAASASKLLSEAIFRCTNGSS